MKKSDRKYAVSKETLLVHQGSIQLSAYKALFLFQFLALVTILFPISSTNEARIVQIMIFLEKQLIHRMESNGKQHCLN